MDFANILQHLDLKGALKKFINQVAIKPGNDFSISFQSMDIIRNPINGKNFDKAIKLKSDPIKTGQYLHPLIRFLFILIASHMVGLKVIVQLSKLLNKYLAQCKTSEE